jgi:branched-chain amino acid transport system substrate-binding protein
VYGSSPPRCGPSLSRDADGQTRDLPASDAIPLHVMWPSTPAGRQHLAIDAETFLVSANAGPSQIAGESCSPWFFSTSWQGDQVPQAVGEYMNQKGVKTAYLLAPNYAAGKDVLAGVKANFKGQIVGEDYTKWPDPCFSRTVAFRA